MERARIGIDGNAAYALLGEDLQKGESEWVTIETIGDVGSDRWRVAARRAASAAYNKLQARLPERRFGFVFAKGHPNFPDADEANTTKQD